MVENAIVLGRILNMLSTRRIPLFTLFSVLLLVLPLLVACERKSAPQVNKTFAIVAEVQPICYYVDSIIGAKVCTPLFPPTVSPEVYELKASDLALLDQNVSLFYYISTLGNEVTMNKLKAAYPDIEFVDLVEAYPSINIETASCLASSNPIPLAVLEDDHTIDDEFLDTDTTMDPAVSEFLAQQSHYHASDPHLWLSLSRGGQIVASVSEALRRTYPFLATTIDANSDRLILKMEYKYEEVLRRIVDSGIRGFALYHPSLNYYADDYNICYLALEDMGKSPVPQTVKKIIEVSEDLGVKTVFVQDGFPQRDLNTLSDAINARLTPFDPMGYDVIETIDNITNSLVKNK